MGGGVSGSLDSGVCGKQPPRLSKLLLLEFVEQLLCTPAMPADNMQRVYGG